MLTIDEINQLDDERFIATFGPLFEGSPWIAAETWKRRPFASVAALHRALVDTVASAPIERQLALIRAHPDLAGKAAVVGALTAESTREQAAAGLSQLTPEEFASFNRLNDSYRRRFSFPFIICAREHSKSSILMAFADRLGNSVEAEILTALGEIAKIARLRLADVAG